jgi:hypothetical protein
MSGAAEDGRRRSIQAEGGQTPVMACIGFHAAACLSAERGGAQEGAFRRCRVRSAVTRPQPCYLIYSCLRTYFIGFKPISLKNVAKTTIYSVMRSMQAGFESTPILVAADSNPTKEGRRSWRAERSLTGAAGGDRTHDPWLRRPILYPLSYSRNAVFSTRRIFAQIKITKTLRTTSIVFRSCKPH